MSTIKVIELAKKLKELALRGDPNEKENAQDKLMRLLAKHNMTLDSVEEEVKKTYYFKVSKELRSMLCQIVSSVNGSKRAIFYTSAAKRGKIGFSLTEAEFLEVNAKYEFYLPRYTQEMELFRSAFIQKNHLYRPRTQQEQEAADEDDTPLTPEERARAWKLANMMGGMEKHQFNKTLNAGK